MAEITVFSPDREKNCNKNGWGPTACAGLLAAAPPQSGMGSREAPARERAELPPPPPLSSGIVGTHELLLTVGAPCYKSSLVPRALRAAEHTAEAAVFVLLLATRSEFLRNGKAPAPVCRQRKPKHESHMCGGSRRPPGRAGGAGSATARRPPPPRGGAGGRGRWEQRKRLPDTGQRVPWPPHCYLPPRCISLLARRRENLKKGTLCDVALEWLAFSGYPVSVLGWVFRGLLG